MKESLHLSDLKSLDPQLGRGLEQLLEFEGNVADTFSLNFQVSLPLLPPDLGWQIKGIWHNLMNGLLSALGCCYMTQDLLSWPKFVYQQVTYDFFGETKTHDLIPGGGDIPVTNENRERYISLCFHAVVKDLFWIDWLMWTRCHIGVARFSCSCYRTLWIGLTCM